MSLIFILMLVTLCSADQPHLVAKRKSFTTDLIHRDSLLLGQHNYSMNSPELLRKVVLRSFTQASHFSSSENFTVKLSSAVMVNIGNDYLMDLSVGDGRYKFLAVAATGSDFFWINCHPCISEYYTPKITAYEPSKLTYEKLFNNHEFCTAQIKRTEAEEGLCEYKYSYPSDDYTAGILSADNFYLESTEDDFVRIVFGCSHETKMHLDENVQGVVGLGRGELSLISQLVSNHGIEPRFSYCLVPRSAQTNSKIIFGEHEITSSDVRISTSITYKDGLPFYYLFLEGIRIGKANEVININTHVIINSGNCMTFLPLEAVSKLVTQVKEEISIEPTPDRTRTFKLCFGKEQLAGKDILPEIVLQFDGGDLHLKTENMFLDYGELKCLAISPSNQANIYVIGSIPQINFWVEYDLKEHKISFTPTSCTQVQP